MMNQIRPGLNSKLAESKKLKRKTNHLDMMDNNYLPPKWITSPIHEELFNRLYHRQDKDLIVKDMTKRFNLFGREAEELAEYANIVESKVAQYRVSGK